MRRVVLDTETTGGSARNGDRVIEVGMVETVDHVPTGRVFHEYVDPHHPIQWGAQRVHGLSNAMLAGYPDFSEISAAARDFISDSEILAHAATFDRKFMEAEFARTRMGPPRAGNWTDTVPMARAAMGGKSAKLDLAVSHFGIETPDRSIHGALLDAAILAAVVARIQGAPDVDIAALASAGRPAPDGAGQSPGRSASGAPSGTSRRGGPSSSRGAATIDDGDIRRIQNAVARAYSDCTDLDSFLKGLSEAGVPAQLRRSEDRKTLTGIRYYAGDRYMTNSQVGLAKAHFTSGKLASRRSSLQELISRQAPLIKAETGGGPSKRVDLGSGSRADELPLSGAEESVPGERPQAGRPGDVVAIDETGVFVAEETRLRIDRVNDRTADPGSVIYDELRSGRDGWSTIRGEPLREAAERVAGTEEHLDLIDEIPGSARDATLRWVCRGLRPDHALCHALRTAEAFERPFPEELTRKVTDAVSPGPEMDFLS